MDGALFEKLQKITPDVRVDALMSSYTTFKIGGAADFLVTPKNSDEIVKIMSLAKRENVPLTVIGNGSNLLVDDNGIRGIVMRIEKPMSDILINDTEIVAGAGVLLSALSQAAQKKGLTGLEFASGIPGTLGGAIYMNAGAYGGEMADVITWCEAIDKDGQIHKIFDHEFGYRKSVYKDSGFVIIRAGISLAHGDCKKIKETMRELSKKRIEKQPIEMPSAGSVFKRPEGYFAGALIEQAGLKGYSVGGAQVSNKHAGFIVNTGSATSHDVESLILHIQNEVYKKFGVMLETEVKVIKGN